MINIIFSSDNSKVHVWFIIMIVLASTNLFSQSQLEPTNNDKTDKYIFNLSADPIGFITLGPSINAEFVVGEDGGISAGIRFPNLGVITRTLFGDMKMSWSVHFVPRLYVSKKLYAKGFFIGPHFEFGRTNYDSNSGEFDFQTGKRIKYTKSYQFIAFGGDIGYKWIFKSGFSLYISDNIGAVVSRRDDKDDPYSGTGKWFFDSFVFYMLSINLGFAL